MLLLKNILLKVYFIYLLILITSDTFSSTDLDLVKGNILIEDIPTYDPFGFYKTDTNLNQLNDTNKDMRKLTRKRRLLLNEIPPLELFNNRPNESKKFNQGNELQTKNYTAERAITHLDIQTQDNNLRYRVIEEQINTTAFNDTKTEDISEAEELAMDVRVLCIVKLYSSNCQADHVKDTWGKRCNKLVFMNTDLVRMNKSHVHKRYTNEDGYLWPKMKITLEYIYEQYWEQVHWFLMADDTSFVVLENLRFMLTDYSYNSPIYFGLRLKSDIPQDYMHKGAYVLSHEAMRLFATQAPSSPLCDRVDLSKEEVKMAACLEGLGVTASDSRDSLFRERFLPFLPSHFVFPDKNREYWKKAVYPSVTNLNCCSPSAVSISEIESEKMYVLEYMIYQLRPNRKLDD